MGKRELPHRADPYVPLLLPDLLGWGAALAGYAVSSPAHVPLLLALAAVSAALLALCGRVRPARTLFVVWAVLWAALGAYCLGAGFLVLLHQRTLLPIHYYAVAAPGLTQGLCALRIWRLRPPPRHLLSAPGGIGQNIPVHSR